MEVYIQAVPFGIAGLGFIFVALMWDLSIQQSVASDQGLQSL